MAAWPALLLLLWMGRVAWQRRAAPGAPFLVALSGLTVGWLLLEVAYVMAPSAALALAFHGATNLTAPWIPMAWYAFALEFTGRADWRRSRALQAGAILGVVTMLIVATMPWHGLFWATAEAKRFGAFWITDVTYGRYFWIHLYYSWGLVTAGGVYVVTAYVRSLKLYQRLSGWLIVGVGIPLVANVIGVFGLLPVEKSFTPIAFALGSAAVTKGVLRYRLLDMQPTARSVLIDHMQEGLVAVDTQGRVSDFNPAFEQLTGVRPTLGQVLGDRLPDLLEALEAPEGELDLSTPDAPRHLRWHATPLGTERQPRGRMILLLDVTALRTALGALEARNRDLDAFAHMVAHDLKNPIHAIHSYATLMDLEGADLTDDLREEGVATILHTSKKMQSIVEELLLLAGANSEEVERVPLDMAAITGEAVRRLQGLFAGHNAVVEQADAWPVALGHAPWVEQVWLNYLTNAVKYGGSPPHVVLGAEALDGGQAVRFWVRDNGAGLTPEAQTEAFKPFRRLHEGSAEGHGVGLAIVQRIVEKLGGQVGVESEVGLGSTFYFTLPTAPVQVLQALDAQS
ncbi:MAG: histidine kinase N-terminal 7TM domain-containing protein [Bacteroidota bacterium]